MNIQHILWNDLVASPRNVRKVNADIAPLAISLAADGLIQNLVVTPREDGKYEVIAGERRRRAIVQLVKAGTWERDVQIACEVRDSEHATAISYAENAQRVAMHPADAIRAFAALSAEGHDEAAIANRYGFDPREVRKMLALASLSPKVLNALAADRIDVATAQAFTLTDDQQRQEKVLKSARTAHEVRRLLTEAKVTTAHRLFRFVGSDAYTEAGGGITRDLFGQDGDGYADDPALVQQLADAKFEALATEAEAAGWGEVITSEQTPYESYSWHRLYPDDGEGFSERAKAGSLLLITLSGDGTPTTTAYTKKARQTRSNDPSAAPLPRPLYDSRMTEDLSRMRTVALQVEVAKNKPLAHAVLLDTLLAIVGNGFAFSHAVQLRAGTGVQAPVQVFDCNTQEMASSFDGVADLIAAVPESAAERFAWVVALDADSTARLLAACTGALIDATQAKFADAERLRSADRIARAAGLDMRQHWEGGIEFFSRLTRKALLAALTEACGPEAAENCAKLGKAELAATCAERIPGRGWLPPAFITPEAPAPREVAEVESDNKIEDDDAANDDQPMSIAAE